jgi:hypothetical protein
MYSLVSETLAIPLRGTREEPVDFARTIVSHGVAELPPNRVELEGRTLETTLPVVRGARAHTIIDRVRRPIRTSIHEDRARAAWERSPNGDGAVNSVRWQLPAARLSRGLGLDLFGSHAEA